jgi:hypothetical protein
MLQIVKRVRDRMRACEPIKGAAGRIRWAHHCKKIVLKFRQSESGRRVLVARSRGYLPSRKVLRGSLALTTGVDALSLACTDARAAAPTTIGGRQVPHIPC